MVIVRTKCSSVEELRKIYVERFPTGGIFCATTKAEEPGKDIVVELSVPTLPNPILIRGVVRSWRPALPRKRQRAGLTVQFAARDKAKVDFLWDTASGNFQQAIRRKHPRIPVELDACISSSNSPANTSVRLLEISEKGALASANPELSLRAGDVIKVSLTPPGAAQAMVLAAKATYFTTNNEIGITFVCRGPLGCKRMRELIKRIRCS